VNYRKPARLDDELLVSCVPVPEGRASIRFKQAIRRVTAARDPVLLAEGEVRVVCVDAKSFKPRALPDFIQPAKVADGK
jgi:4-hydroxybenzoyl-CoA thioesterase